MPSHLVEKNRQTSEGDYCLDNKYARYTYLPPIKLNPNDKIEPYRLQVTSKTNEIRYLPNYMDEPSSSSDEEEENGKTRPSAEPFTLDQFLSRMQSSPTKTLRPVNLEIRYNNDDQERNFSNRPPKGFLNRPSQKSTPSETPTPSACIQHTVQNNSHHTPSETSIHDDDRQQK
ncbi:unnamed protein product [Didymodactylos carnosus]|nr:unnamed protein product [Didymodactylos carnosus]CAF1211516.1 unnamed protein product [Didymodactylos carnosus]CAF3780199.1 unnamed protein product [Didymodactylos carnosus]CAF3975478.1 unnamed protein product [Didymodactylos carnosus]